MSRCRKLSRKISSFVLLAAMLLSMAKPVSIYAQDEGAVEKEDQKIVQDNVVQDNAAQDTVLIEQETQLTDIPKEEAEANGQSGENGQGCCKRYNLFGSPFRIFITPPVSGRFHTSISAPPPA